MRIQAALVIAIAALTVSAGARASGREGGDDVRVRAACAGARTELRLHADGDVIEVELRVDARSAAAWQLVLLHERTLVFKGLRRPSADGYSLRLRRTVPDWPGRETVTARMQKTGGRSCRLTATI